MTTLLYSLVFEKKFDMKHNLKNAIVFCYHFLKINGLIPFHFDFNIQKAFNTTVSSLYSIVFSLIFWSYLTYCVCDMCRLVFINEPDSLMMRIEIIDMATAYFKALTVCILQIVKRRKIVESINLFMNLSELVFGSNCNLKSCFLDSNFKNSCKNKCWSISIQIMALVVAFTMHEYNVSFFYAMKNFVLVVWINITTTIATSVFYCGSMLFSARFYQILSEKLKKCKKGDSSSGNNFRTIDQISSFYENITTLTSKVSDIYVFLITTSLIGIIVWVSASVS